MHCQERYIGERGGGSIGKNGDLQANLEWSQHSAAVIGCFHHLLEPRVYGLEYIKRQVSCYYVILHIVNFKVHLDCTDV